MLLEVRSASGYRPADKEEVLLAAARYAVMDTPRENASSPKNAIEALRRYLGPLEREMFVAMWLDSRNQVLDFDVISIGTVDSAVVPVREVARKAIERNAVGCLLVHYVSGHRMRLMCPVSICGLRWLEAVTTPVLPSYGPHNGRLRGRWRVHVRQGRMVIAGPGRSDAIGAGGSLRGCPASSAATDRRSKVLSGLSWRARRSSTPPPSCAS